VKLKRTEIKSYRELQLQEQQNLCALCQEHIIDDAVLDHDHKSGRIRRVLHRGCNALLGKIENNLPLNRITISRLNAITNNLVTYIETKHTDILHPTHKEKKMTNPLPVRGMRTKKNRDKKPPKKY
jgi:hypothetical protein